MLKQEAESIKEKKHVVAYLDILGAKNKIKKGDVEFLNQLNSIYGLAILNSTKVNKANGNENLPDIKQSC